MIDKLTNNLQNLVNDLHSITIPNDDMGKYISISVYNQSTYQYIYYNIVDDIFRSFSGKEYVYQWINFGWKPILLNQDMINVLPYDCNITKLLPNLTRLKKLDSL
ncbi:hypothetical protein M0Q50_02665 [bacterium]|jgi:hypothetical protein|nr:hypothetical protein [bacterium]